MKSRFLTLSLSILIIYGSNLVGQRCLSLEKSSIRVLLDTDNLDMISVQLNHTRVELLRTIIRAFTPDDLSRRMFYFERTSHDGLIL